MSESGTILSSAPADDSSASPAALSPAADPQAATLPAGASTWRDALPDDLKADPTLKNFKDVADLAKGYAETKRLVGNAIKIPKADAPQEEWDAYAAKVRPEKPDDYQFTKPDGKPWDDDLEASFRAEAHKLGLPIRTAAGVLAWINQQQDERVTAMTAEMDKGLKDLRDDWGPDFDKRAGLAALTVQRLGGQPLQALLLETGMGNHPLLIKAFADMGAALEEDHAPKGGRSPDTAGIEGAKAKIAAIRTDPKHPYNDPNATPKQKREATEEMRQLYKVMHPDE